MVDGCHPGSGKALSNFLLSDVRVTMALDVVYRYNQKNIRLNANQQPLLEREKVLLKPTVSLATADLNKKYFVIMYDPDAPQPAYLHWLVANIPGGLLQEADEIAEYYPPKPPSGTHRYFIELYEQDPATTIQISRYTKETPRHGFNIESFRQQYAQGKGPIASYQYKVAAP